MFQIFLRVRDDAPYDNTKIDFNLQIADKNTTVYENISYSVYVGEYVEVDDETTPDDFIAALDNITEVNADEDTYAAIVEALDIYSALTATEKAEVEDAYAKLLNIIGEYNTASDSINTEAQTATSIAFSVLSGAIEYISKLLAVLRQMIWG